MFPPLRPLCKSLLPPQRLTTGHSSSLKKPFFPVFKGNAERKRLMIVAPGRRGGGGGRKVGLPSVFVEKEKKKERKGHSFPQKVLFCLVKGNFRCCSWVLKTIVLHLHDGAIEKHFESILKTQQLIPRTNEALFFLSFFPLNT